MQNLHNGCRSTKKQQLLFYTSVTTFAEIIIMNNNTLLYKDSPLPGRIVCPLTVNNPPGRENGVALVVALILLVALTLIGINALETSLLETRMATNAQEKNYAFQMAETALAEVGEDYKNYTNVTGEKTRQRAVPAITSVIRDNGKVSIPRVNRTFVEFKGISEPSKRSTGGDDAVSMEAFEEYHFEAVTIGQNIDANDVAMQSRVRNGFRQLTPKSAN